MNRRRAAPVSARSTSYGAALLLVLHASAFASAGTAAQLPQVIVWGSTAGGVAAAVAASRSGASVTLVDASARLGGMVAGGLSNTDKGDVYAIGGIARELFLAIGAAYNSSSPVYAFEPHVAEAALRALLRQANVSVVRAGALARVERAGGGSAAALAALVTADGQRFAGAAFVDASYEGDVMLLSGAAHAIGREPAARYGESWGGRREPFSGPFDFRPLQPLDAAGALRPLLTTRLSAPLGAGDGTVQGYNYRLCATQVAANRLPFPPPAAAPNASDWQLLRELAAVTEPDFRRFVGLAPLPRGKFDMNNGCLLSTDATGLQNDYPRAPPAQRAAIAEAHRQYMLAFFAVLQGDPGLPAALRASAASWGLCADEFTSNGGWPEQLYIREAARLVGDRVLTQRDLWPATDFGEGSIGMGSYPADGHYSTRGPCIVSAGNASCSMATSEEELAAAQRNGTLWVGGEGYVGATSSTALYQIPYFALLPRRADATNLLCPLTPSASHVTFASLRMEPQFMILGQAAGAAAALAAAAGVAVQDLPPATLRAALLAGGAVLCKQGAPACAGAPPALPHAA
jgi:hypothetical protein